MIDTHAHLYSKEFDQDIDDVINRALSVGIGKIFLPNIDLQSIENMNAMRKWNDLIYPMMGLHPCSVKEDYPDVLAKMKLELDQNTYYGIGETGIDLYWDKTTLDWQLDALSIQCAWAVEKKLPIILHTRNANEETISFLEKSPIKPAKGVFHCFSGTLDEIKRIDDLGDYYYGIGGVITYKNAGLYEMIHHIPLQKIVVETDAPYLAPVPFRGKRNETFYITYVLEKLAQALNMDIHSAKQLTTENADRLFFNKF